MSKKDYYEKSVEWQNFYNSFYKIIEASQIFCKPESAFNKMILACSIYATARESAKSLVELQALMAAHQDFFVDYFPKAGE